VTSENAAMITMLSQVSRHSVPYYHDTGNMLVCLYCD